MTIINMQPDDWVQVRDIYLQGIATGNATFRKQVPEWEEWDKAHTPYCRFVGIDEDGVIIGWAALSPVSSRPVYAGVQEVAIYVHQAHRGKQTGSQLLEHLIAESEAYGVWTLQSGIFPENTASLRLHKKAGFRIVGYREKIGQMDGVWRDTLLLERRSKL